MDYAMPSDHPFTHPFCAACPKHCVIGCFWHTSYLRFRQEGTSQRLFERFTERARQVVVLAQEEARTLKHNYIATEHILLGLLREEGHLLAPVLRMLAI